MRITRLLALLVPLALATAITVRAQDAPPMGAIFGYVTDIDGNVQPGAVVVVADMPDISTPTGPDGSYYLSLPAGDHLLVAITFTLISDQVFVSVPADDTAFVNVVPTNFLVQPEPQPEPQPQPQPEPQPQPQPQPQPEPLPPPPTATPIPAPVATPTPTSIPLASLSGSVKNDDGSQPPVGTQVLILDLPSFFGSTGTGGAYSVPGLPLGRHFVMAQDPLGAVSDRYSVPVNGDTTLNINMQRFPGGNPTLFIGRVVGSNRSSVSGARVWRIGGAGVTTSGGDGTFQLVDASRGSSDPDSNQLGRAPDAVTFVAAKGDQWGMLRPDPNNPGRLEITLDQQGTPPPMPRSRGFQDPMNITDRGEQYFTAKWRQSNNSKLDGIQMHIKRADGSEDFTDGNGFGNCVGDCSGSRPNGFVIKLPRNQNFTLEAWDSFADKPWRNTHNEQLAWDEAQVVHLP